MCFRRTLMVAAELQYSGSERHATVLDREPEAFTTDCWKCNWGASLSFGSQEAVMNGRLKVVRVQPLSFLRQHGVDEHPSAEFPSITEHHVSRKKTLLSFTHLRNLVSSDWRKHWAMGLVKARLAFIGQVKASAVKWCRSPSVMLRVMKLPICVWSSLEGPDLTTCSCDKYRLHCISFALVFTLASCFSRTFASPALQYLWLSITMDGDLLLYDMHGSLWCCL